MTYELLIERYNSDLANTLGNLVNRTISMVKKYFDGVVPNRDLVEDIDSDLFNVITTSLKGIDDSMDKLKIADALDYVFEIFKRSNKYIDETMPWNLAKENKIDRLSTILYNLLEAIRIGAIVLSPFLPNTSDKIFAQLNSNNKSLYSVDNFSGTIGGTILDNPQPLFVRIDKEKILEEL